MSRDYPAHSDFDYSRHIEELHADRERDWARKPWIAIATSEAWADHDHLEQFVDGLAQKYEGTTLILPERAVGGSKIVAERAELQGCFRIVRVPSEAQWGSQRQAVQASHMIRLADVVVTFWAGGTDLAKAVIDKALLVHRPAPQFDPGLHVYEMTKTKATKSTKSRHTGRIRYRTRKDGVLIEPERKAA